MEGSLWQMIAGDVRLLVHLNRKNADSNNAQ